MACSGFLASRDPRLVHCARCGRARAAHAEGSGARDATFEATFLGEVVATAQRLSGVRHDGYVDNVCERLALGRQRYGDDAFLGKRMLDEVRDETPDVAGYAVLELRKQKLFGLDATRYANLYQDLLAASAYACVADWYAQRAARRLVEVRG